MPVENYCLIRLRAWTYPVRWYFEFLYESKTLPDHLRIDKRLETTIIATMQAFLSNKRPNILTNGQACSTYLFIYLFFYIFIYLFIYLSICLFIYLFIYLFMYLFSDSWIRG